MNIIDLSTTETRLEFANKLIEMELSTYDVAKIFGSLYKILDTSVVDITYQYFLHIHSKSKKNDSRAKK